MLPIQVRLCPMGSLIYSAPFLIGYYVSMRTSLDRTRTLLIGDFGPLGRSLDLTYGGFWPPGEDPVRSSLWGDWLSEEDLTELCS